MTTSKSCQFSNPGTPGGYLKHRRANEPACAMCLTAWRLYYRKRRHSTRIEKVKARVEQLKQQAATTDSAAT